MSNNTDKFAVQEPDGRLDPQLVVHGDTRNVIDRYRTWTVEAINDDLQKDAFRLHVAIENYQHDYNIGTIVRSANAFNVAGVHIVGKRHWNRRGAMATEKYLQLYHHESVKELLDWCSQNGLTIVGVDNIAGSHPLSNAKLEQDAMYVFGQEGPGLSTEMQAVCSKIIGIEQYGSTRSLNLGVAAGIVLHEWVRQNVQN